MSSLDLSSTQFAKWSQSLMNALVNLHGINAEAVLDSKLPRIVVFGDQSAGKSSLVEGVTGIRVPRDSGTCTRCPMELAMFSTGEIWTCDISLHFKYDADGRPLKLKDERKVIFGETLHDKAQVDMALRRAQAAILHPSKSPDDFLEMPEEELRSFRKIDASKSGMLKFSKNVISVTIHDQSCANLCFLDLPGLITNEAREVIELVQDLAVNEIEKENSLILVTIPMTGDMELQTAVRLAREVDPEGLRTIGVLTKPDAVPKGATNARRSWMEVLSGQEQVLQHGYYCVRLPDDDERMRNLSKDEYNEISRKFFEQEAPWNTLLDKRRLGIPGLVDDLSRHLTVLIDKALPKIRVEVQSNLDRCRAELKALPPAPKLDASVEILKMVNDFCHELEGTVFGTSEEKTIVQNNHDTYDNFKKSIRATAPNFILKEIEDFSSVREVSENVGDESCPKLVSEPLYLRDVRRIIKRCSGWELPHNVPFEAKRHLIKQFTDIWDKPINTCYLEILKRLEELLHRCVGRHFKYFSRLRIHILTLIEEKLQFAKESAQRALQDALRLERDILFTLNEHYFNSKRDVYLSRYKAERKRNKINAPQPSRPVPINRDDYSESPLGWLEEEQVATSSRRYDKGSATERALGALAELGYEGLTSEDLGRLIKPDPFEEEITVMADVMAYFHVAFKRVIDQVPRTIEVFLNRNVCEDLQSWLVQKFDIGSHDAPQRLAALISFDPEITATRARLESELIKLRGIQKELRNLGIMNDVANSNFDNLERTATSTNKDRASVGIQPRESSSLETAVRANDDSLTMGLDNSNTEPTDEQPLEAISRDVQVHEPATARIFPSQGITFGWQRRHRTRKQRSRKYRK